MHICICIYIYIYIYEYTYIYTHTYVYTGLGLGRRGGGLLHGRLLRGGSVLPVLLCYSSLYIEKYIYIYIYIITRIHIHNINKHDMSQALLVVHVCLVLLLYVVCVMCVVYVYVCCCFPLRRVRAAGFGVQGFDISKDCYGTCANPGGKLTTAQISIWMLPWQTINTHKPQNLKRQHTHKINL